MFTIAALAPRGGGARRPRAARLWALGM